ncbi:MAG: alkaline shock response membrane anchor protein AmaP [Myxococcota bacterium]
MSVSSRIGETTTTPKPGTGRAAAVLLRIGTGVLLVLLAAVAAAVFLVALDLVPAATVTGIFTPLGDLLSRVTTADVLDRAIVAGAAAVIGVVALALLTRTQRSSARSASRHVLHSDDKGFVLIDSESVETVAEQAALLTAGVLETKVTVSGRPSGPVRLRVRVEVLPGADVKRIGPRVQEKVRRSVEDLVGLSVRDANVEVRVKDLDDLGGVLR